EAIDQFGGEGVALAAAVELRDASIDTEPDAEIGDVALRDQHRHAERDLRRPFLLGGGLAVDPAETLGRSDRLFEHVLVEFDADLADMAGLLVAEQVAGAAYVEIVTRELKSGAERVQGLHHVEPPRRGRR